MAKRPAQIWSPANSQTGPPTPATAQVEAALAAAQVAAAAQAAAAASPPFGCGEEDTPRCVVPRRPGPPERKRLASVSASPPPEPSVSRAGSFTLARRPSVKFSDIAQLSRQNTCEDMDSDMEGLPSPRRLLSCGSVASRRSGGLSRTVSLLGPHFDLFPKDDEPCTPRAIARPRLSSSPPEPVRGGGGLDLLKAAEEDENDGRFRREFEDVKKIGEGHFSIVFSARHTVDRCLYAVKRTKQITRSQRQVQEAFALASIASDVEHCPNIVRYNSSWFECGQLFIQMELCEGSLRDHMQRRCEDHPSDAFFPASEIMDVVRSVANGLHSMHTAGSGGFVHLDIKPDNIMRGRGGGKWKIGDFGLAVAALNGCDDVCEGDCRYLAREVLRGDLSQLEKGDVFSLGAMAYELAINPRPLPGGGEEWQALRDGFLDSSLMPDMPPALFDLIASLIRPSPAERPSCGDILQHHALQPESEVQMLQRELERIGREAKENRVRADKYRDELFHYRCLAVASAAKGRSAAGGDGADFGDSHPGATMAMPAPAPAGVVEEGVVPRARHSWARRNTM
eukprot:CAMPEP_0115597692 /NCGR_PEP_ID=MMETSP0272-20121206/13489_1 /TAXON_ID=71861 /ORGANISM="Scrippsiella trochoidea, Strain CCMP3099" /LENGTH=566 /DNA_ID=CAMNT_0003033083 /DNA_START=1 /DNA_END=1701 /DNA_ORIENTATION=-